MVYPLPLLVITLSAYAIMTFIIGSFAATGDAQAVMVLGNVSRIILGIFGIIGVIGIFIGLPIGVVFYLSARKKEKMSITK